MKFSVECHFSQTVRLGGLLCDSVDFTVEAPSERVAKAKVMACYPLILNCNVKPIGNARYDRQQLLRLLRLSFCIYFGVSAYLLAEKHFGWVGTIINAIWISIVVLVAGYFCVALSYILLDWLDGGEREQLIALEQEYSRREGYREGWFVCERKAIPQFINWAEQDSLDIDNYPGPAKC